MEGVLQLHLGPFALKLLTLHILVTRKASRHELTTHHAFMPALQQRLVWRQRASNRKGKPYKSREVASTPAGAQQDAPGLELSPSPSSISIPNDSGDKAAGAGASGQREESAGRVGQPVRGMACSTAPATPQRAVAAQGRASSAAPGAPNAKGSKRGNSSWRPQPDSTPVGGARGAVREDAGCEGAQVSPIRVCPLTDPTAGQQGEHLAVPTADGRRELLADPAEDGGKAHKRRRVGGEGVGPSGLHSGTNLPAGGSDPDGTCSCCGDSWHPRSACAGGSPTCGAPAINGTTQEHLQHGQTHDKLAALRVARHSFQSSQARLQHQQQLHQAKVG